MSNQLPEKIHFGVIVEGHKAEMHECPFPEVGPEDIVIKMAVSYTHLDVYKRQRPN